MDPYLSNIVCAITGISMGAAVAAFLWKFKNLKHQMGNRELTDKISLLEASNSNHQKTIENTQSQLHLAQLDLARSRQNISALEATVLGLKENKDIQDKTIDVHQKKTQDLLRDLAIAETNLKNMTAETTPLRKTINEQKNELDSRQSIISELSAKVNNAAAHIKALENLLVDQKTFIEGMSKQTLLEFENLASKVLKEQSKDLSEKSGKTIDEVLKPLKDNLSQFQQKVVDTYSEESRERFALKKEIERLIGLNNQMTSDTKALTDALKGDSKFQGDWGEMVLERMLQASGLTEGQEYTAQGSHEDTDGNRLRPDFRINLPDNKHIIIDSKVSLTAYEEYKRASGVEDQKDHLAAHVKSILRHIEDLSKKGYDQIKGIHSPEFVFMFIPIEPAYLVAMHFDPTIAEKAWRKGVAIVTSTTLLTSLKTVEAMWKLENQNKNAMKIADEASKLYDKFVGLHSDLEAVGKSLSKTQDQYQSAIGKLQNGPGNVIRKLEVIRELGANPRNRLRQDVIDASTTLKDPELMDEVQEQKKDGNEIA